MIVNMTLMTDTICAMRVDTDVVCISLMRRLYGGVDTENDSDTLLDAYGAVSFDPVVCVSCVLRASIKVFDVMNDA